MLADLWHAPDPRARRSAARRPARARRHARRAGAQVALAARAAGRPGKPADRPNMVMGANVQVCWEKFANYWDVEPRLVPMEGDRYHLDAGGGRRSCATRTPSASSRCSARRSTAATSRSPRSAAALDELQAETGLDVPVHVDGASGGFDRAVPRPRPRVGLPAPARRVDQHLGPQVRPRLPRRRLGRSGATARRCPRTWSSTSTTSAATCRRSR